MGNNIRMDLGDIVREGVDCLHLSQSNQWKAFVNTVMNFWTP